MEHGYMQTELDLAFRPITTFYMHRRLRQSRRLPSEINTAAEEFHEEIHQTLAETYMMTYSYMGRQKGNTTLHLSEYYSIFGFVELP